MPLFASIKNDTAARMGLARFPSASHWANAQCKAWWIALPGLVGGRQWYDVLGQYPWTISYATYTGSGSFQRPRGYWSPTYENGDYVYNAADNFAARPGSLSNTFLGPFQWNYSQGGATQQAYGTCNLNINRACPTAGTISLWLRPGSAAASESAYYISQGTTYATDFFGFGAFSGTYYCGFTRNISTNYRVIQAIGSEWTTSSWLHLTLTWAAGDYCRLYANGKLFATASNPCPNPLPTPSGTSLLGVDSVQKIYFSKGCLDDLCVWSYQMSAQQVQQVYWQSSLGWPGRLEARPALVARRVSASVIFTGTGGIGQGGDPQAVPVPIVLDSFTDSSGTELSRHTADSGEAWSEASGYTTQAFITGASRLRQDSNNVGQTLYYQSTTLSSANYSVAADLFSFSRTLGQTAAGVVARYDASSGSFYAASYNHHAYEWELLKYQSGSFTTLGTYPQTINTSQAYTVQLSVGGVNPTSLTLSVGGAVLISVTDSSSPITGPGKAGILLVNLQAPGMTDATGDHLDNFVVRTPLALIQAGYNPSRAGGVNQGGSRFATVQFKASPGGGTNLGGNSVYGVGHTYAITAAGGVFLGGATSGKSMYRMTPGGGVVAGGVASSFQGHTYTVTPGGGMFSGGHNPPQTGMTVHASGGYRQGGWAAPTLSSLVWAGGGMSLSGNTAWRGVAYHIYANTGVGDAINYSTAIATASDLTWTSKALTLPGHWKFGVRAFDQASNLEEQNVDAVVDVMLNAAGVDVSRVPPPPSGLSVIALAGGSIRVLWSCPCSDQERLPTGFHVYLGAGSAPNYSLPVTTVPASSGRMGTFSAVVSGLTDSIVYSVGVRSFNSMRTANQRRGDCTPIASHNVFIHKDLR